MKDWHEDRNREDTASRAKAGKGYGQNSAWDHDETLVMKTNPIHEDVDYSNTVADLAKFDGNIDFDAAPIGRSKKEKIGTAKRK